MANYPFKSPADFKDVNAKMIFDNAKDEVEIEREFLKLKESSRDHSRTVMQWNGTKNAGFTSAKPWTYVNSNYKSINVEKSLKDKNSILNNYIAINKLRLEIGNELVSAKYKFYNKGGVVGYKATNNNVVIEVMSNLSKKDKAIKLLDGAEVLYSNMPFGGILNRYQTIVVRYTK